MDILLANTIRIVQVTLGALTDLRLGFKVTQFSLHKMVGFIELLYLVS